MNNHLMSDKNILFSYLFSLYCKMFVKCEIQTIKYYLEMPY